MAKHIIIDSLARSGTTLLSALMRSQIRSVAFCPGFNEPLSYKNVGSWPHGICRRDGFISDADDFDFDDFKNQSVDYIIKFKQLYHLDAESWQSMIMNSSDPLDIYKKIEVSFSETGEDLFFYRWNQCFSFAEKWLSRGDAFKWLTVIRNPLDRACSSFEKHEWPVKDSLENTLAFAEKLNYFLLNNNSSFQFIYYEDLIKDPEKIVRSIYSSIGEEMEEINLTDIVGSNGSQFVPQTSENKYQEKVDGYVPGKKFDGFYDSKINRYKKECTREVYELFKQELTRFPFYTKYFND